MREIRFRLWDKENKKMIVRDSLYTYFIGLLGDIGRHDVCGNVTYNNGHKFYSEQFETMQYTGLKDKNGKEIYEGDIYHQGDKNILYVVVWHDTSFIGKQLKSSSYAGLTYWLDRIEVIGNIYDNPDLLKTNAKL